MKNHPCAFLIGLLFSLSGLAAPAPDSVEGGWYNARFPVPVMHLEGSIEEVARAHGLLVSNHPESRETLSYFAHVVQQRLQTSAVTAHRPRLRRAFEFFYRHFVRNLLIDYTPERYRTAFAEFAHAAGLSEDEVWNALVLPDASLRIVSLLYNVEPAPVLPANFGCTSVIWDSGHSSVLHGRNLDYEGVGYWDQHPVIMHVIPQEGLAYVAVTALGVPASGLTAFNEAGLTLAIHQLTLADTQASGTPMIVISAEVIRNARSIDDAIAIIRSFPRAGGWAYVLSQGRDRAVIETSANEIAIRRSSEPFFFQTNHVSSPALASHQIFYSPGAWIDSFSRADQLASLQKNGDTRGWATPDRMAPLLGSGRLPGTTPPAHVRVAGGTVAKLDNIQSVIMDASHRRLWIALGTAKRAPNENRYVEYRWADLRSAAAPEATGAEINLIPADQLGEKSARLRELLRQVINKKRTAFERSALLTEYAQKAIGEHGNAALAGVWPGIYLHIWQELKEGSHSIDQLSALLRQLDLALRDSDLSGPHPAATETARIARQHRQALGRYSKALILDLLGRRSEALYEYYVVERQAGFERLKTGAAQGLLKPFGGAQARALAIDWAGVDLYQY